MTAHQSLYLESSARLVADARLSRRGIAACHRAILSPERARSPQEVLATEAAGVELDGLTA
jgi:hypothetical protein